MEWTTTEEKKISFFVNESGQVWPGIPWMGLWMFVSGGNYMVPKNTWEHLAESWGYLSTS